MPILVSTTRTSFERLKRDLTDVSNATFSEWADFINKFLFHEMIGVDPERFIDQATTYTITTSPSTQALPADFKDISTWGTGFFYINSDGDDTDTRLARTGFGSTSRGYYIQGTNVVFTGIESTGDQYRLRYIPEITTIDQATDYFTHDTTVNGEETVPDEYLENIVKALDVLYDQWDEDVGAESIADVRFVRALGNLISTVRKEPNVYGLPDHTLIY